jgi:hypothetical protein
MASRRGDIEANHVVEGVGDRGVEVIIDASELVAEYNCLLEASFHEGFGVVVKAA